VLVVRVVGLLAALRPASARPAAGGRSGYARGVRVVAGLAGDSVGNSQFKKKIASLAPTIAAPPSRSVSRSSCHDAGERDHEGEHVADGDERPGRHVDRA
jgi:hypothetical protein